MMEPMIAHITGTVIGKRGGFVVLEAGGIGYRIAVTPDTLAGITKTEASLFTYLAVRENALDLYGFLSEEDRSFFELLLSVSGIGPKTALSILSLAPGEALKSAVAAGDTSYLTSVSGIGRKSAEKIVLELKDKLRDLKDSHGGHAHDSDTVEALKALGYSVKEAREAVQKIDSSVADPGARIKEALRNLAK